VEEEALTLQLSFPTLRAFYILMGERVCSFFQPPTHNAGRSQQPRFGLGRLG
jgi:hypothetical protein